MEQGKVDQMNQQKKTSKRFEEYQGVDCNECDRYYTNECDGVQKAQKRTCNSFLATRSVIIPEQIKTLKKDINWLYTIVIIQCVSMFILGLMVIFGG